MKLLGEKSGIETLSEIRSEFGERIRASYEINAKPCSACETPGICCRDEHFVNVHITKLEAAAISQRLEKLDAERRELIHQRLFETIEKYDLGGSGDSFSKTYACPLFVAGTGCLVHDTAKPLPCIAHACYENKKDLPPDGLLLEAERSVASLNRRVYGRDDDLQPLPLAVSRRIRKHGQT